VRVSTAFNRMLGLAGARVVAVSFGPAGVVAHLRLSARRLRCPCGWSCRARYDQSRRRWRHLDLAGTKLWLQADIRRLSCRRCGTVRTEQVLWARPGARHSTDFEDMVAWLAQRTDKTTTARLMRASWEAVDAIVARVVAAYIDQHRLDELYRVGVDEISYRRGHHYLTVVADHDRGRVVWVEKGKRGAALEAFYQALGEQGRARLQAVPMDLGTVYRDATRRQVPGAVICFDPFHVVQLANRALDAVYMSLGRLGGPLSGRDWRATRYALRAGAEKLTPAQLEVVGSLRRGRYRLWRPWDLKEGLRDLYRRVEPAAARAYLRRWLRSASSSRIPQFVLLARTVRHNFEGILAAVEHGLSNSRLEGINAGIRLVQRRGYGYRSVGSLRAAIYLCLGGIVIDLPTRSWVASHGWCK
jgi:transposase